MENQPSSGKSVWFQHIQSVTEGEECMENGRFTAAETMCVNTNMYQDNEHSLFKRVKRVDIKKQVSCIPESHKECFAIISVHRCSF